jgi:hypothetical protein
MILPYIDDAQGKPMRVNLTENRLTERSGDGESKLKMPQTAGH